jgi:hypothetical protein
MPFTFRTSDFAGAPAFLAIAVVTTAPARHETGLFSAVRTSGHEYTSQNKTTQFMNKNQYWIIEEKV